MTNRTKKTKALDLAMTQIDRQFGKGSIMRLGSDSVSIKENVISTGCLSLDVALGVGGIPRGRIIEIFGPEACAMQPWKNRPVPAAPFGATMPCSPTNRATVSSPSLAKSDEPSSAATGASRTPSRCERGIKTIGLLNSFTS